MASLSNKEINSVIVDLLFIFWEREPQMAGLEYLLVFMFKLFYIDFWSAKVRLWVQLNGMFKKHVLKKVIWEILLNFEYFHHQILNIISMLRQRSLALQRFLKSLLVTIMYKFHSPLTEYQLAVKKHPG